VIVQGNSLLRSTVGSLGAVLLLAAALAGPVAADERRPMHGNYTIGVGPVEQRCGPNALTIGFAGEGIATHLGRMEGTGSNCTSFDLTTNAVPIWDGCDLRGRRRVLHQHDLRGRTGRARGWQGYHSHHLHRRLRDGPVRTCDGGLDVVRRD